MENLNEGFSFGMHMIPYDPRKGYHTKNLNGELVAICMPHQKQSVNHSDKLENLQDVVFYGAKNKDHTTCNPLVVSTPFQTFIPSGWPDDASSTTQGCEQMIQIKVDHHTISIHNLPG